MKTQKNQELIVKALQDEVIIQRQIIENQATILGMKETQIYQSQLKIDKLEDEISRLFWSYNRPN